MNMKLITQNKYKLHRAAIYSPSHIPGKPYFNSKINNDRLSQYIRLPVYERDNKPVSTECTQIGNFCTNNRKFKHESEKNKR